MPWSSAKDAWTAVETVMEGRVEQGVKMLHASLFADLGWNEDAGDWEKAVMALGMVNELMFEKEYEHTMLSMWCVVLAADVAPSDVLDYVVDKLFIDGAKFHPDPDTSTSRACTVNRLPGATPFRTLKDIMENTDNRASVDESLILTKILANHGGAPFIVAEGVEALIIHASAPLCPVAVTTETESIPIIDEDAVTEGVIMWSDGKISSAPYIRSCWREASVDACCSVLKVLTEFDAEEFANDWGRQLAIDSTSEHTISILNSVSNLPHSYLITSTLLPPIITKARFIHKNSVLTYLVTDHPEYLSRRWFLETLLPVGRGTFTHLLLSLYENIATCLDPCFRTELTKVLSIIMGWEQPCRKSDSEAASPELLEEIVERAKDVERRTAVSSIANPEVLTALLELSVFRDEENKYSMATRWASAITQLLETEAVAPYLKDEGKGVGAFTIGHIPRKGDIMVNGLLRIISLCPEAEAVLKIWEACFPCHELGPWTEILMSTTLVQTVPHEKFDFRLGWLSLPQGGDTAAVKDKCLTKTFIRHLYALCASVTRGGTAILVGPSSHKSALGECYASLVGKKVLPVAQREMFTIEAWLKGGMKDSKYEEYDTKALVLHLTGGVLPTKDLYEAAAAKGVVVISSLTPKQFKLCEDDMDAMWCSPLPVDEVAEVLEWYLRKVSLSEVDQLVPFMTQYYTATARTSKPQTLRGMTDIARKVAEAEAGSHLNACVFEIVGWYGVLEEEDRAVVRVGVRRKNCPLAARFEEAAKDSDPEAEAHMQALMTKVSQSRVQTFVKDKFALGKTKLAAWKEKAGTRWANRGGSASPRR